MQVENKRIIHFGDRLRLVLKKAGVDNVGAAKMAEVTPAAIGHYVNKGRIPKQDILRKLADALEVNIHWLMTGEGPAYTYKGAEDPVSPLLGEAHERGVLTRGPTTDAPTDLQVKALQVIRRKDGEHIENLEVRLSVLKTELVNVRDRINQLIEQL